MRTSKPIATISYNTDSFLIHKLNNLIDIGVIDFYSFIKHLPEEDEKKEHKHLFIVPSGLVDTNSLIKELEEIDDLNDLPLKCMPFRNSKFSDWFMYSLHDENYLASKYMIKKYHYCKDDFIRSDETYFSELIHTSDFTKYKAQKLFLDLVHAGYSFADILEKGVVP